MKSGMGREIPYHHVFDDAFRKDPYAFYSMLRTEAPVLYEDTLRAWIVTRADDVTRVLKDVETFSSNRVDLARARFTDPSLAPLLDTLSLLMLQRDDPDHRRLRKLVHHAFERTAVERYEGAIRTLAGRLLDEAAADGRMEFVADFAVPLPILVISEIVGIPPEDRGRVKAWCDAFSIVALNFYASITDEQLAAGNEAVAAFRGYVADRLEEHRASDDTSLLTSLAQAEADGQSLSLDELLANVLLMLNAGNETTSILLTNGLHQLLERPEAMARLRADPALIPAAVEEMLRFEAPVHFIGRVATAETALGDRTIAKGDVVLAFLASAGRDGERFDAPETFDIDRSPNRHVSFGNGPHLCSGLQLARMEARIAFETLLETFSDIRLAPGALNYGPNLNLRSFAALPIEVTRRS